SPVFGTSSTRNGSVNQGSVYLCRRPEGGGAEPSLLARAAWLELRSMLKIAVALAFSTGAFAQPPKAADLGFKDTPILPGLPWHVHDPDRPHPAVVAPGTTPGSPPSDAIILFNGKDLSKWASHGKGPESAQVLDAKWKLGDGYFEVA